MKVISVHGLSRVKFKNSAVAIGIFDGVHRGHQLLLSKMLGCARRRKAQSVVVTFFPHPAHVLRPDLKLLYLMPLDQRLKIFKSFGIDICVVVDFNKRFAAIDPEFFIEHILVKKMNAKDVFVGEDFRFGKDRRGDVALFERMARELNFSMHAVKALTAASTPISSSRIRKALAQSDVVEARRLLGRPYEVSGTVVRGAGRGKGLGFPTANVQIKGDLVVGLGVYAVCLSVGTRDYSAVANLGLRPSFNEKEPKVHLEVHVLDFKKNIYGKNVRVTFIKKIREEQRFESIDALKKQIVLDIRSAKHIHRIK